MKAKKYIEVDSVQKREGCYSSTSSSVHYE